MYVPFELEPEKMWAKCECGSSTFVRPAKTTQPVMTTKSSVMTLTVARTLDKRSDLERRIDRVRIPTYNGI